MLEIIGAFFMLLGGLVIASLLFLDKFVPKKKKKDLA